MGTTKSNQTRAFHLLRLAIMLACWFLSSAAYAHTHTVNCPDDSKTFPTINSAIAASTPGATIIVCPGIYPENVVVNVDHLKITAKITGTAKVVPGNPLAPGFLFTASYDQVLGFAISGFLAGLSAGPGTGHEQIKNNFIFDNGDGISFTNSSYNHVKNNRIIGNDNDGVNDFITIALPGNENDYDHNDVEYNGSSGILVISAISGSPVHPEKTLTVDERAHIEKNTVDNNTEDGIAFAGLDAEILQNDASYNGGNGIDLANASGVDVRRNTATWNGASISACGPSEGSGECNGLRLRSTTVDNTVEDNTAKLNLVWDARDSSTGSGTAGTANTWSNDTCPKDSPEGICTP